MHETEITVQCFDSLEKIFAVLSEQGFIFKEEFKLNDRYFSGCSDEELRALDFVGKINKSVLVRKIEENGGISFKLLHKSKIADQSGNILSEEKTQAKLYDSSAADILARAGLNNWCNIYNCSYVYGDMREGIELAIQVIEGLGIFIEFEEYDGIKACKPCEKFELMKERIKGFGLNLGEDFSVKKAEMIFEKRVSSR